LGNTDLTAGQRVVPHSDRPPESGLLQTAVGLGTGELQVILHPVLRGEEPQVGERLRRVEMIGDSDCSGLTLPAELFDPLSPCARRRSIEPGRIETLEQ